MRIFTLMSAVAAAINTRIILPLTFALMLLVVIDPTIATAHHREGHDKGDSGGGGGNEGRESFNSGALMGTMHRFDPSDDIAVSNKSKPPVATTELVVKSSRNSETRTFVKFTVTGVVGPVVSAKILLRSEATSGFGGELRQIDDIDWSEDSMTWKNQPVIDFGQAPISAVGRVVSDVYYEWDVRSIVMTDGDYSFAMTCDNCSAKYQSKEATLRPYLVVVEDDGSNVPLGDLDDPVLVGAGDIASCGTIGPSSSGAEKTAKLLDDIVDGRQPDQIVQVFTSGDGAYPDGTLAEFQNCYHPTWGRHFDRTNPTPGNHEYNTLGAEGYFTYFGSRAGDPAKGYYSYDIGNWHIVALNSNCTQIGGCGTGSPQHNWLMDDLVASGATCIAAYLHHPPHSSGEHGSSLSVQPLMQVLIDHRADILVAGHDHNYERFAPQDATGLTDLSNGIRVFVVGSGGTSPRDFRTPVANSEARFNSLNGVLELTLHPSSYDWEFIPVAKANPDPVDVFSDMGSAFCH